MRGFLEMCAVESNLDLLSNATFYILMQPFVTFFRSNSHIQAKISIDSLAWIIRFTSGFVVREKFDTHVSDLSPNKVLKNYPDTLTEE